MSSKESKRLYDSKRWRDTRALQLQIEPLCRMCYQRGDVTAATVADHIQPHRGNEDKFWRGELQSLCASCHSSDKQALEKSGRVRQQIGMDGWPTNSQGEGV